MSSEGLAPKGCFEAAFVCWSNDGPLEPRLVERSLVERPRPSCCRRGTALLKWPQMCLVSFAVRTSSLVLATDVTTPED